MTKQLSITVSDWVYDSYLLNFKGNRSRLIEEMIVKGFEVEEAEMPKIRQRLHQLIKKNKELEETTTQQQRTITKYATMFAKDPMKHDKEYQKEKAYQDFIKSTDAKWR